MFTNPIHPIKALFLDIDGTLVASDETISPRVRQTLQCVREMGVEVVLCTGRTRWRLRPILHQVPAPVGYVITSNGSVMYHVETGVTHYRHLMPIPLALKVIRLVLEAGSEPYVFEDSDRLDVEGSRVLFHPDRPVGEWAEFPRYRSYTEIAENLPFEPVSVSAFGHPSIMRPLAAHLIEASKGELSIIQTGSAETWGVEIYVANISKQLGVESVAKRLNLSRTELMAIGDHINDIEMLQWAGIGVAMGNAQPEVRAVADWITSDVESDGVAHAIERCVLNPALV